MSIEKPRRQVNDNCFLYVNTKESIVPVKPWCVSFGAITAVLYTITIRFKYRFSTVFKLTGTEVYLFSYKLHFPFFIQFFYILHGSRVRPPAASFLCAEWKNQTQRWEAECRSSAGRQKRSLLCELDKTTPTTPSTPQHSFLNHHGGATKATVGEKQLLLLFPLIFSEKTKKDNNKKTTSDSQSGIVPTINCCLIALCKRCSKSEGKEIRV